jgi:hypothetical protein
MLLAIILVRNQIRDMLGGETGKITFGKLCINLGRRAKRIPSRYNILVHWDEADFKIVVKFMTVCHTEGFDLFLAKGCDRIVALTPCKQKYRLKLSAHIHRTSVYA